MPRRDFSKATRRAALARAGYRCEAVTPLSRPLPPRRPLFVPAS